jgi:major membrane immunogen (membrane-anchored lipoprotein)
MKKMMIIPTALCAVFMCGCSGGSENYADGTYEGQSEKYVADTGFEDEETDEDSSGYGVVSITIEDGKITACTFKTYEIDGTLKDEDYGKEGGEIANRDYYNKAQKAIAACDMYAESLVYAGRLDDVDAISGATVNYNEFNEAVKDALKKAVVK